jgi:hypothetical protein
MSTARLWPEQQVVDWLCEPPPIAEAVPFDDDVGAMN